MNRRDMSALLPVMQGLVALRDMIDGKDFKAAVEELAEAEKKYRAAAKAAADATQEREAATKKNEESFEEYKRLSDDLAKQQAQVDCDLDEIQTSRREFDEYRDAENARLEAWEKRLSEIPDKSAQLDRKLAAADRKLENATTLEQQWREKVEALGLKPAA